MKFSICNETFQGLDWETACRIASDAGYGGIEIAPFTLAEDARTIPTAQRDAIRQAASRHNLEIVGLHWLLVSPKGLSVTSPNEEVRRETSSYLISLVDLCADLNGKIMVFGSPSQRRIPEDGDAVLAGQRFRDALLPALDLASERGVIICLEPLPAPEANFLLTLEDAAAQIASLNHPAARTILDVKSACSEKTPIPKLVAMHAPIIAHVHANDANRRGPGFGDTDFVPILDALNSIRYGGYVSVEVFDYSPNPTTIAVESLKYLEKCVRRP